MQYQSLYKYSSSARFSKKFGAYLIELFIVLILTLVLYSVADFTISNAKDSVFYNMSEELNEKENKLLSYVKESKLSYYDEKINNLASSNTIVGDYIYSIVLTSLHYFDEEGKNESHYDSGTYVFDDLDKNIEHDRVRFYYETFKVNNQKDYSDFDQNQCGLHYYQKIIFDGVKNEESDYFTLAESGYPILNKNVAIACDAYITEQSQFVTLDEKEYNGYVIYTDIYTSYYSIFTDAMNDFLLNCEPYHSLYLEFGESRDRLVSYKIILLMVIYALIILIYFSIIPCFIKNGQTIVDKIMKIGFIRKNGDTIAWYQNFIKVISYFLSYFVVNAFVFTLLYNNNSIAFLNFKLFGFMPFYVLYIISIVYLIANACFGAFDKKYYQTLGEKMSFMIGKFIGD